jgi:hypothetical protein
MSLGPELLLVGAVATVGVLHTIVPDHWVPISLIARQRGWSKGETARASLLAGVGHVLSTLVIALAVWFAGVVVAARFGQIVDTAASLALVAFGAWIAIAAWRELRGRGAHSHSHPQYVARLGGGDIHEPEQQTIASDHGDLGLGGETNVLEMQFTEHDHVHDHLGHDHGHDHDHGPDPVHDPLYSPLHGDTAVLTRHVHIHRHGPGAPHTHWHDHFPETAHLVTASTKTEAPLHEHRHKTSGRTALLLVLGSSPMVEGIPAFFAASKFGVSLIIVMSVVFAISTIATYVLLCVFSTAGLQRVRLGAFERYGEVLSGVFIALVGVAFWISPLL